MTIFLIYGAVLLGYLALFLAARGGFSAAASLLCRSVFAGQRFPEEAVRKALAAGLAATLLAAALSAMHRQTDTVREGYLEREAQGGTDYEAALRVETEEGSRRIDYVVEARSYTPEEARQILKAAEERAFALALGENGAEHVAEDLHLPGEDPEAPVSFSWVSGDTELLGWDGRLADGIPAEEGGNPGAVHFAEDGAAGGPRLTEASSVVVPVLRGPSAGLDGVIGGPKTDAYPEDGEPSFVPEPVEALSAEEEDGFVRAVTFEGIVVEVNYGY